MILILNTDRTTAGTAASFSDDDLVEQIHLARDVLRFDVFGKKSDRVEYSSNGWLGYDRALSCYAMVLIAETLKRGILVSDALVPFRSIALSLRKAGAKLEMPPWWGNRDIMNSHRSFLMREHPDLYNGIFKGEVPKRQPRLIPMVYDDNTFDLFVHKTEERRLSALPSDIRKSIGVLE